MSLRQASVTGYVQSSTGREYMPLVADVNERIPAAIAKVIDPAPLHARSVLTEHYCISITNAMHGSASGFLVIEFPTSRTKPLSEIAPLREGTADLSDFADYLAPLRVDAEYGVRTIAAELPLLPWDE